MEKGPLWKEGDGLRPISWYSCGPTVYDDAHVGHGRAMVLLDVMRRGIESFWGRPVRLIMGVTDVDDKILKRASEREENPRELAKRFEDRFWKDVFWLGVDPPSGVVRVSEHVESIVEFIEDLKKGGLAYESYDEEGNGGWFFDVEELEKGGKVRYGVAFGGRGLQSGRDETPGGKKNPRDFALWKKDEKFGWQSALGTGRPGWHIECSAMSKEALGEVLDVHSGGVDLAFPHHTNELAQSEGRLSCCGDERQWVGTFLHTGLLLVDGKKMSKSLGNFLTVRDLRNIHKVDPMAFRVLCLRHSYGGTMPFSLDAIKDSQDWLNTQKHTIEECQSYLQSQTPPKKWSTPEQTLSHQIASLQKDVILAFADDFNTPKMLQLWSTLSQSLRTYISTTSTPDPFLLHTGANVLTRQMQAIGITIHTESPSIDQTPVLDATLSFRDQVRSTAINILKSKTDPTDAAKQLLSFCDTLRDQSLPQAGIPPWRLRDKK